MTIKEVIAEYLPSLPRDVAGIIGVGLVLYGTWLWCKPLAFTVAGLLLVAVSLLLSKAAK